MGVSKYNSEGYYDPTAYEALTKAIQEEKTARYRPLVYICSPYSGDMEGNTEKARRYSRFAADAGTIPIAPHLLFPQILRDDHPIERQLGLVFGLAVLCKCAEVWVFGSRISPGMEAEIKRARWKNIRLRHFTEECEEVL